MKSSPAVLCESVLDNNCCHCYSHVTRQSKGGLATLGYFFLSFSADQQQLFSSFFKFYFQM